MTGVERDSNFDLDWVRRMLLRPKKEKRHQWHGWLSDGLKKRFLAKLQISRPEKLDRVEARRKVYRPLCGDELVCVDRGTPYESSSGLETGNSVLAFGRAGDGLLEWRR
jgi:hypothetical protein